ncbi:MAG: amidohydrolase family protein [Gammaproteobacteria bacterium]|nr:amidohydrolase family protein [Gammaproteobacteria bacterium]
MKSYTKLAVALFTATTSFSAFSDIYIHAGQVIDGLSARAQKEKTIIIADNKIKAIKSGYLQGSAGDTIIDAKNKTVMPGLMDMHTHLSKEFNKNSYSDGFKLNAADFAFQSVGYAKVTLDAGFTTVRDLGDSYNVTVSLKNAINSGLIIGPRIYTAAKSIATTGGHADPTNGHAAKFNLDPGPKEGVINGTADAYKAVRQRYKDGADLIKITATGGVLSVAKNGQNPQFTVDEVEAIVKAAKDYDMTVAVHAHGKVGMERAIKAGVSSIEHGTYMSERTMELMKQYGTFYVPTITAGKYVAEKAAVPGFYPSIVQPKAAAIGPKIQDTFKRAYKAGVKIAFGTDAGVFPHGDNWKEFVYMTEAGMSPMAAIQSATMGAASLLKIDETLGSIEIGKIADIIAVDGNPLDDIWLMEKVSLVIKNGVIYKQ